MRAHHPTALALGPAFFTLLTDPVARSQHKAILLSQVFSSVARLAISGEGGSARTLAQAARGHWEQGQAAEERPRRSY